MTANRDVLSDRGGSERLVHPLLQTARGYLTDEDYFAVEATLTEAVERAKDMEAEIERLREANDALQAINKQNGSLLLERILADRGWRQVKDGNWRAPESPLPSDGPTRQRRPD